jgi:hypothetical protein
MAKKNESGPEYRGPYADRYEMSEHIPHVGVLADKDNADGWYKVDKGYVKIVDENGKKFAVVTDEGRKVLGRREPVLHTPSMGAPEMGPSNYRIQIYAIVENIYGSDFRADFVDETPEETKKSHKYILYVRPRTETRENRMMYKLKMTGTLKEIYDKMHEELAKGITLKVYKGKGK